jgi:Ricin-type beta-trefoil lectin domain-like
MKPLNLLLHGAAICMLVGPALAAEPGDDLPGTSSPAPASFQVRNKKFAQLLRPEEANSADGTRLVLYPAQPWKCMTWKLHPAGGSAFTLQNHFTSKTFAAAAPPDAKADAVTQVPFVKQAGSAPVWTFTKLPDGAYKIADSKSGKVLTAVRPENEATAKIVAEEWHEKDEQKWELIPIDPKDLTM